MCTVSPTTGKLSVPQEIADLWAGADADQRLKFAKELQSCSFDKAWLNLKCIQPNASLLQGLAVAEHEALKECSIDRGNAQGPMLAHTTLQSRPWY